MEAKVKEDDITTRTPTFKKLNKQLEAAATIFDAITANGGEVTFEQLRELNKAAVADAHKDTKEETLKLLNQGLDELEQLSVAMPFLSERLRHAAGMLVIGAIQVGIFPAGKRQEQEKKRIKSILIHNNSKAAAVERAQAIATELWQADTAQEIRLGEMADKVYRALAADGFADLLPGSTDRIKEWIRMAAPEYASKGGRRRKNT